MSTEKISEALSRTVSDFTWLIYDAFLLLLVVTLFLGYKEYDAKMQAMMRAMIALSFVTVYVSSLHILIWIRVGNNGQDMSPYVSYGCHLVKAIALGCYIWKYVL